MSYVPDGDTLLTPAGGRWKLSLREGQAVRVRLRGPEVLAQPEFVPDVNEVERLLRRMIASNPRTAAIGPDELAVEGRRSRGAGAGLGALPERERQVLILRFGLNLGTPRTLDDLIAA